MINHFAYERFVSGHTKFQLDHVFWSNFASYIMTMRLNAIKKNHVAASLTRWEIIDRVSSWLVLLKLRFSDVIHLFQSKKKIVCFQWIVYLPLKYKNTKRKYKSVTVISMLNIYISFNSQINFQPKKKTSPGKYSMNIVILCNRLFQHRS